ncbi:unnamed protein product [Closterium sp. NIES-53]
MLPSYTHSAHSCWYHTPQPSSVTITFAVTAAFTATTTAAAAAAPAPAAGATPTAAAAAAATLPQKPVHHGMPVLARHLMECKCHIQFLLYRPLHCLTAPTLSAPTFSPPTLTAFLPSTCTFLFLIPLSSSFSSCSFPCPGVLTPPF